MLEQGKIEKERERMELFNKVNSKLKTAEDCLTSLDRIISGNDLGSIDSFNIGCSYFYGEDKKRLAEVIRPEFEKMRDEARLEMEKYFKEMGDK